MKYKKYQYAIASEFGFRPGHVVLDQADIQAEHQSLKSSTSDLPVAESKPVIPKSALAVRTVESTKDYTPKDIAIAKSFVATKVAGALDNHPQIDADSALIWVLDYPQIDIYLRNIDARLLDGLEPIVLLTIRSIISLSQRTGGEFFRKN